MRSRNAAGMVSSILAVAMKTTWERSKGTAEIIVAESRVLLGVEHLQHGRRRVALDSCAHLVDFVEHHHAIARAGLADRLDDIARHRADIGAAMAADFRPRRGRRPGSRARNCGPWRVRSTGRARSCRRPAGRRNKGSAPCRCGASLRTARYSTMRCLIFSQAEMIGVENAARLGDVDRPSGSGKRPGQFGQPVEIVAQHAQPRRAPSAMRW